VKTFCSALLYLSLATSSFCFRQNLLRYSDDISLPRDTIVRKALLSSLQGFLDQKDSPNKNNAYVNKDALLETSALLDEMKDIDNLPKGAAGFYKCYLSNVVALDDSSLGIQVSYVGKDEKSPLRAIFNFIAELKRGAFHFSSPLKSETKFWNTQKIGSSTFHFKSHSLPKTASLYASKLTEYESRLNNDGKNDIYYCSNLTEALSVVGIQYKKDYNGIMYNGLSSAEKGSFLDVLGYKSDYFDPHDLWHDCLLMVISPKEINRPVDEGCAYLYGGSWVVYSWQDVLKMFKEKFANTSDWIKVYNENKQFGPDPKKPLYSAYVLNGLIVNNIETEKGFAAVYSLLSCGPKQGDNENYFAALKTITGVGKDTYSKYVGGLLKKAN